MTVLLTCACGNHFEVADAAGGQLARCPGCGRDVPVPGSGTRPPEVPGGTPADRPADEVLPGEPGPRMTSRWAVAGLVVGLLSFGVLGVGLLLVLRALDSVGEIQSFIRAVALGFVWVVLLGVTAVVTVALGIVGVVDVGTSQGRRRGMSVAIAAIVLGILPILLGVLGWLLLDWQERHPGPRPTAPDARSADLALMQGTWKVILAEHDRERNGDEELGKVKVVIAGDRLTIQDASREVEMTEEMVLKLDPGSFPHPRAFDFHNTDGKETNQGIYKLEGDRLTLYYADPGQPRPKEFASRPDAGLTLLVLHRAKP